MDAPAKETQNMIGNTPSAKEKGKALDLALQQIEKQFGKGAIMKLGEDHASQQVEVIPTGSIGLDLALGGAASSRSTGPSLRARPRSRSPSSPTRSGRAATRCSSTPSTPWTRTTR